MSIIVSIFEIIRAITFYLVCGLVVVLCLGLLSYIIGFNYSRKTINTLVICFIILIIMIVIDNTIYSVYHVHLINTKVALGAPPDPIW